MSYFKVWSHHLAGETKENHENFNHDSQPPGQDSSPGPNGQEAMSGTASPRRPLIFCQPDGTYNHNLWENAEPGGTHSYQSLEIGQAESELGSVCCYTVSTGRWFAICLLLSIPKQSASSGITQVF